MENIYFNTMINNLKNNTNNLDFLLNNLITSFSLYYLSDHYIGNELEIFKIPIKTRSNNLLINDNIDSLINMQILFVQNNFFDIFIKKFLPNIHCKFILITGQWNLPKLEVNNITKNLLFDNRIHKWFSQNPVFKHPKYIPFPYGLNYGYNFNNPEIIIYAEELLKNDNKSINILNLPMNYKTNPCRNIFPKLEPISNNIFYKEMHNSKFILSPIGDRDDCYRHWEAIGLGTIPITNITDLYKDIFQDNMIYINNTADMLKLYDDQKNLEYKCPNKNLICVDYWKDYIKNNI